MARKTETREATAEPTAADMRNRVQQAADRIGALQTELDQVKADYSSAFIAGGDVADLNSRRTAILAEIDNLSDVQVMLADTLVKIENQEKFERFSDVCKTLLEVVDVGKKLAGDYEAAQTIANEKRAIAQRNQPAIYEAQRQWDQLRKELSKTGYSTEQLDAAFAEVRQRTGLKL